MRLSLKESDVDSVGADDGGNKKYHLVKWDELKNSMYGGGLGLRSIVEMNFALQGKWLWGFLSEDKKLLKRVVDARWGDWEQDGGRRGKYKLHGVSL